MSHSKVIRSKKGKILSFK